MLPPFDVINFPGGQPYKVKELFNSEHAIDLPAKKWST